MDGIMGWLEKQERDSPTSRNQEHGGQEVKGKTPEK